MKENENYLMNPYLLRKIFFCSVIVLPVMTVASCTSDPASINVFNDLEYVIDQVSIRYEEEGEMTYYIFIEPGQVTETKDAVSGLRFFISGFYYRENHLFSIVDGQSSQFNFPEAGKKTIRIFSREGSELECGDYVISDDRACAQLIDFMEPTYQSESPE